MEPTQKGKELAANLIIHHGNNQDTPIVTGCPFPADLDLAAGVSIAGPCGEARWGQAYPLTNPMANNVRWWELSFLSAWEGDVTVVPAERPALDSPLAEENEHGVKLNNGLFEVFVSKAAIEAPVSIIWNGGSGMLKPRVVATELGTCEENPDGVREIKILRNGPVRAQVELCGTLASGNGAIQYRLTVEIWQGCPGLRVDWMLTHACPGISELTINRASLTGQWNVGRDPERVFRQSNYGSAWKPRDVVNPAPVTLIADDSMYGAHVADAAMLLDDTEYPFYCAPPVIDSADWLELRGDAGRVSMQVLDFAQTQPNALISAESELSYDLVPEGKDLTWCQGWRKEQTLLLAFALSTNDLAPVALAARAAIAFALGRAQPNPVMLRQLRCFELDRMLAPAPGRYLRVSGWLDQLCTLNTRTTKMDLGDTPDWHYTSGYASSANSYIPLGGFEDFPRHTTLGGFVFPDAVKYFLEPVWTNNEYDIIHTIATEVMRTGVDKHFQMLRWAARHNVEIDFLSYSDDPWHHRASPFHSHFHNRKGAITSHFWTQGLLQYYCLTGDRDALEVARALGDKIIEVNHNETVRTWKFDREIGWALLALCCLVEAGETQFLKEARTIASYLQEYDREAFTGAVNLSMGKGGRSLERQMIDNAFGYASMVEGLDRYQRLAGDEASRAWFLQLLIRLKDVFWEKIDDNEAVSIRSMVGLIMTIGYERTEEPDFLLAGQLMLERWLDPTHNAGLHDVSRAAGTEGGQTKPCAMAYRGLHRLLGALDRVGCLDTYEYPSLREHRARLGAAVKVSS